MNKQKRTAIYMRVSTKSQKPDLQQDGLEAYALSLVLVNALMNRIGYEANGQTYASRAGLSIVASYLDVAVSGRKQGRPQLKELMSCPFRQNFRNCCRKGQKNESSEKPRV